MCYVAHKQLKYMLMNTPQPTNTAASAFSYTSVNFDDYNALCPNADLDAVSDASSEDAYSAWVINEEDDNYFI